LGAFASFFQCGDLSCGCGHKSSKHDER
jgi:predicted small metal-binding protein